MSSLRDWASTIVQVVARQRVAKYLFIMNIIESKGLKFWERIPA